MAVEIERLKNEAIQSHLHYIGAQGSAFQYALQCGELLHELEKNIPSFTNWMASNMPFSARTGFRYMRAAQYRSVLEERDVRSLESAMRTLSALGLRRPPARNYSAAQWEQAARMRKDGKPYAAISEATGIKISTLQGRFTPGRSEQVKRSSKAQNDRRAAARLNAAARLKLQREALEAAGEGVVNAYDLLAMVSSLLEGLVVDGAPEVRGAVEPAANSVRSAMNRLVKAIQQRAYVAH